MCEFNKEQTKIPSKEQELIHELNNCMQFFEPIKSTIPFENMRPQNKIIFSCTLILWKLFKEKLKGRSERIRAETLE